MAVRHSDNLKWDIYALLDPITKSIRYIGMTSKGVANRVKQHVHKNSTESTHKAKWINKILRDGHYPYFSILESGEGPGWQDREKHWIGLFSGYKHGLTNSTIGGDGIVGLERTHKHKENIKISLLGRTKEEKEKTAHKWRSSVLAMDESKRKEWLRKIGQSNKGKIRTQECKEKISLSKTGVKQTIEHRKATSVLSKKYHDNHKILTDQQISYIYEAVNSKEKTGEALAEEFKVSRTLISRIKHNKYRNEGKLI